MAFPSVPRSVLVTGCSTGIGEACARMLRDRGWTVYPTARKAGDLQALEAAGFTAIELDLADSASVLAAAAKVLDLSDGQLGALVNNAGFGQPGAMEDLSREALRYQFEVNVFGMQQLTNQFIPLFRKQGRGRIVNVSSVVGRVALPFLGAYSASKFAMEAISDALRVELVDSGVAVSLIEPGPIITAFRTNAVEKTDEAIDTGSSTFGALYTREVQRRRDRQKKVGFINKPPEAVGNKVIHALESSGPRRRYGVTPVAPYVNFVRRFAPACLVDALFARSVRKKRG
jgi:NAD(P)-dependent dehydrogenase (short-subunit alcohol dehydrogenase family)